MVGGCMAEGMCGGWGHVWGEVDVWRGVVGRGCVQERLPLKRAVRILLECILILQYVSVTFALVIIHMHFL